MIEYHENKYALMKMPCSEIGRALACGTDEDQASVINALARELRVVCRDKDLTGMQVCYMAERLDESGKMLVRALVEYVNLRDEL